MCVLTMTLRDSAMFCGLYDDHKVQERVLKDETVYKVV